MKGKKKWLSMCLALLMALTMIPSSAFALTAAGEPTEVSTEAELVKAIDDEAPVILIKEEIRLNETLQIKNDVTFIGPNGGIELTVRAADKDLDPISIRHMQINKEASKISFKNVTLAGNGWILGGGIEIKPGNPKVEINGLHIKDCITDDQGGGIKTASNLVLTDAVIEDCVARLEGGGIYAAKDVHLELYNSQISGGESGKAGAGIFGTEASILLDDSTIEDCYVSKELTDLQSSGGGIAILSGDAKLSNGSKIKGCIAAFGGGIFSAGGNVTLEDAVIEDCLAEQEGGGISAYGGKVTLLRSVIQECEAILVVHASQPDKDGNLPVVFEDPGFGGGIQAESVIVSLTDSEITSCSAGSGGGIYLGEDGVAELESSKITDCEAIGPESALNPVRPGGYGGGICVVESAAVSLSKKSVIDNCLASFGGGILLRSANATLDASRIENCVATQEGGGISVYGGNVTLLAQSQIKNCKAVFVFPQEQPNGQLQDPGFGGGIQMERGKLTMKDSQISQCFAGDGGGAYLGSDVFAKLADSQIIDNEAARDGGGIYTDELENVSAEGVYFAGNTASAAYETSDKDIVLHEKKITDSEHNQRIFTVPFDYAYNNYDISYKGKKVELCTVNFDANGGGWEQNPDGTYGKTSVRTPAKKDQLIPQGLIPVVPTLAGHDFVGWYKESTGENGWDFDVYTVTSDVTLYAKWEKNVVIPTEKYDVTFDAQGGSAVLPLLGVPKDSKISKPIDPTKSGHDFVGWYKESTGENVWDFDVYTVTSDITLYAKWKEEPVTPSETYDVTFDSQGGSAVAPLLGVPKDSKISKPTDPTKSSNDFAGWYKESTGENAWDFDVYTVTSNITLYAKWTANSGGGNGGSSSGGKGGQKVPDEKTPLGLTKADHIAYVQGYPEGDFRQEKSITRAEAAQLFYNLLIGVEKTGYSAKFPDVKSGAWYADAVNCLSANDVILGYPDGNFSPDTYITRAEFATLSSKFDELSLSDTNRFNDVSGSHWAVSYINSAAVKGWIKGYENGEFRPERNITRAEVVTLVNAILERKVSLGEILPDAKKFTDLSSTHWAYCDIMEAANEHTYSRKSDGLNETWHELVK